MEQKQPVAIIGAMPVEIEALLEIAESFYGKPRAVSHSRALLKLSGILLRQLEDLAPGSGVSGGEPRDVRNEICDYIMRNFNRKLSLKSLAAEFGRSPESIRKMFQKHYPGVTPGKLIAKLQIQEAVELLENTDSPIGLISRKCGFTDVYTFSKKFKRIVGLSPRVYRASLQMKPGSG